MAKSDEHSQSTAPGSSRPRRWRRIALRVLLGVLVLGVALAGLGLWSLANLEASFFKRRIQAAAQTALNTDIDYDELSLSPFSGLSLRGLVVQTPSELADAAPELLRIDALDVDVGFWGAMTGNLTVSSVTIGPVALTIVSDDQGRTSLSLLGSGAKPEPEPEIEPTPISQTLEALGKGDPFELLALSIAPVSIELIDLEGGRVVRRRTMSGAAVEAKAALGVDTPAAELIVKAVGPDSDGAVLALTREVAGDDEASGSGKAAGSFQLAVAGNQLTLRGSTRVLEHSFADVPPAPFDALAVDLVVDFEPDASRTRIALRSLELLGDVGSATLEAIAYDRSSGGISRLSATGSGRVAFSTMPIDVPGIELDDVDASYEIDRLDFNAMGLAGALSASARVGRGRYAAAGTTAELSGLRAAIDVGDSGAFGPSLTVAEANATVELESFEGRFPDARSAAVRNLRLRYDGENLALPGGTEPERNRAELSVESLAAGAAGSELEVDRIELVLRSEGAIADIANDRPVSAILTGPIARVRATAPGNQRFELEQTAIDVDARKLNLAGEGMLGLGGRVIGELDVKRVRAAMPGQRITGDTLGVRADVDFDKRSIEGTLPLGRLVAASGGERTALRKVDLAWSLDRPLTLAPGEPGSARARLEGSIARVDAAANGLSLPALSVDVRKSGAKQYRLELDSAVRGLSAGSLSLPQRRSLKVVANTDLARDVFDLDLDLRGPKGERIDIDGKARFAAPRGALAYELTAAANDVGALLVAADAADVGGVDSRAASVKLRATGNLSGALVKRPGALVPGPVANPLDNLRGKQDLRVELADIAYRGGDTAVSLPALTLGIDSEHKTGGVATVNVGADFARVEAILGPDEVKVAGFRHRTRVDFGAFPTFDRLDLSTTTTIARADHTYLDGYRVGDVELEGQLVATPRSVQIESLRFANPAGRTRLEASGALERWSDAADPRSDGDDSAIHGRSAIRLTGTASQNMATFVESGFASRASGTLDVPFEIDSGDLVAFRARLALHPQAVTYVGPDESLVVEELTGYIPVTQEVLLGESGVESFARAPRNMVARTRFFDVQPFLDIEDYIAAERITVSGETFGPIAGNLRINGTTFSMDQLQAGYRGGTITGKLIADYRPGDTTIMFRGNATGIKPSGSDEVLDANAAFTFRPDSLALTGKLHLVRLAKEHLTEILDTLDPFRSDTAINRVRLGLRVGYPKFARVTVKEGLMNAKIELGGAAGVVRIDEIRAIPVAPLLEQHLGPVIDALVRAPAEVTAPGRGRGQDPGDDKRKPAREEDAP